MEPTTNVEASCVAETTGSPNAASALQAQPPVTTEGEGETQGEPEAPPETKKRGRPKGSKNKKSAEEKTVFAMPAPALAPTAGPVKKKRGRSRKNPEAKPAAPLERKKLGRPPGSKNKPKNDPPAAAPKKKQKTQPAKASPKKPSPKPKEPAPPQPGIRTTSNRRKPNKATRAIAA